MGIFVFYKSGMLKIVLDFANPNFRQKKNMWFVIKKNMMRNLNFPTRSL